ncbi:MAG: hypothetical protein ACYDGR_00650 [Candidatus Dormibacteria bacterium]
MLELMGALRWILLVMLAGGACIAAAWHFDLYTPSHVAATRRLLRMRGLLDTRPIQVRVGERIPFLKQLARETSLTRLLAISGSRQEPGQWVAMTAGLGLLVLLVLSALSIVLRAAAGSSVLPLWLAPSAAGGIVVLAYAASRQSSRGRRQTLTLELGDMLVTLGVLVGPGGASVEDALLSLARCTREKAVYELLRNERWTQLVPVRPRTQYQLFWAIGDAYEVPLFRTLGDVIRSVTVKGLDPLEQYTNLATSVYSARLADAQSQAARAKIKLAIPVAGMILPLLVLLTAPLIYAIVGGGEGMSQWLFSLASVRPLSGRAFETCPQSWLPPAIA